MQDLTSQATIVIKESALCRHLQGARDTAGQHVGNPADAVVPQRASNHSKRCWFASRVSGRAIPDFWTIGGLDALRAIGRAVTLARAAGSGGLSGAQRRRDPPRIGRRSGAAACAEAKTRSRSSYRESATCPTMKLGSASSASLSDFPPSPLLRALGEARIGTEVVPGVAARDALRLDRDCRSFPLPPQSAHYSWDDLVEIMARLRMGCPWDREQTHRTLVPYLIEETFEVVEAIEIRISTGSAKSWAICCCKSFSTPSSRPKLELRHRRRSSTPLSNKMVSPPPARLRRRRHRKTSTRSGATGSASKHSRRRAASGAAASTASPSISGALQRGQRMQEKASRVGFDWPDVQGVLDKLSEELLELAEARRERQDDSRVREELGDVFSRS